MRDLVVKTPKKSIFSALAPRRGIAALRYVVAKKNKPAPARHDNAQMEAFAPPEMEFKHISFTFAIISLSAKLAMADGALTRESYIAFRDAFPLSGGLCGKLRKLFVMACDDPTPMEHVVQQVKHIFPRNRPLFYALVARMFAIAAASRPVGKGRERFLTKLAHMLEVTPSQYSALYEEYVAPKPHHVLGVEKKSSKQLLKKRYHALMQRYHPDRYANEELSPEVKQLLSLRTAEISAAYRVLSQKAA
jgi:DnaJ like chaperone protein